jgi:hypothetical protein
MPSRKSLAKSPAIGLSDPDSHAISGRCLPGICDGASTGHDCRAAQRAEEFPSAHADRHRAPILAYRSTNTLPDPGGICSITPSKSVHRLDGGTTWKGHELAPVHSAPTPRRPHSIVLNASFDRANTACDNSFLNTHPCLVRSEVVIFLLHVRSTAADPEHGGILQDAGAKGLRRPP